MHDRSIFSDNAARLRALYAEIKRAFAEEPRGPAHTAACHAFHASYDALAFPGGLNHALKRLKRLEPAAVEEAIRFLEVAPWFFRSGFIKEELVRRLKQAALTDKQRRRLAGIVTRSLLSGTRRSARHLARLAPLADSGSLRSHLESVADSSGEAARRARHVLQVLQSCPAIPSSPIL